MFQNLGFVCNFRGKKCRKPANEGFSNIASVGSQLMLMEMVVGRERDGEVLRINCINLPWGSGGYAPARFWEELFFEEMQKA